MVASAAARTRGLVTAAPAIEGEASPISAANLCLRPRPADAPKVNEACKHSDHQRQGKQGGVEARVRPGALGNEDQQDPAYDRRDEKRPTRKVIGREPDFVACERRWR